MDEGCSSWVRRAKFSHTVCHRLDRISSISLPTPNHKHNRPTTTASSPEYPTSIPKEFEEARSEVKRFSTPSGRVRGDGPQADEDRGKGKGKGADERREQTWSRCFDSSGGKVNAVEMVEDRAVDLSQLYFGAKFATGANSRLYHGLYRDETVAVKVIALPEGEDNAAVAAQLVKQFKREVGVLSRLCHRNVLKLVGSCSTPPVFIIITEYLSGGCLRAFLHKLEKQSLAYPKMIAIALGIARGMEYVHSQGIFHCDLKPENILFDQGFCVKIADFGIACDEVRRNALGGDPGTFRWMAPEMIRGKKYGRKVDVYSFGLILWEMLTGRIPYDDMTPVQAAFAVVNKDLRPIIPSDCPPSLRALIEQCWMLLPDKRPEFWQIVKVLEQFESALKCDGTLNQEPNLTFQEHKKRLRHWIQKLRPPHATGSNHPVPRLF